MKQTNNSRYDKQPKTTKNSNNISLSNSKILAATKANTKGPQSPLSPGQGTGGVSLGDSFAK